MVRSVRFLFSVACALLALAIVLPRLTSTVPSVALGLLYGVGGSLLFAAILRSLLPQPCDSGTPALRRRYLREFLPPMLGYVIALMLSVWLLKRIDTEWLRVLVALLPLPPIMLAVRAIVRHIRDTDELQQKIELAAVSIATALVSLLYLAGGFLQLARIIDIPSGVAMIWVFPLICFAYGIAKLVVSRRYN